MSTTEPKGSADEFKKLINSRGGIKSRITIFSNYFNTVSAIDYKDITKLQIDELQLKLSRLQNLLINFDNVQEKIEMLSPDCEEQVKERETIENNFCSLITRAQNYYESYCNFHAQKDNDNKSESNISFKTSVSKSLHIKLPTIDLPHFDGNSLKWLEYRDTFSSLVNENESIPEINKFHYLRSSLEGGAAVVIKSIAFSAENYKVAWDLLCNRYNNTRLLVNNHLKALFSFQPLTRETHQSLRYMIDYFTKNLRALGTLKEPTDSWGTLIIFMMISKLDGATCRKWEEHRNSLPESPKLEDFYTFLRNRADVLETVQFNKFDNSKSEKHFHSKETKITKSFFVSNGNTKSCAICTKDHFLHECDKFKHMSVDTRSSEVARLKLCANCLRPGHRSSRCFKKGCQICNVKHNTLLHMKPVDNNKINKNDDSSNSAGSSRNDDAKNAHDSKVSLSSVVPGQVLLCTAQVEVVDPTENKTYSVKALLDSGSQSSFVTEALQKKINLPVSHNTQTNILGINNNTTATTQQCEIQIKSRVNSFRMTVSCLLIPQITSKLPGVEINTSTFNLPANIELADPSFFSPSDIHVLLGADVFWEIVHGHQIRLGRNKPTLQESELGWLISGPTGVISKSHDKACHFTQNVEESLSRFWDIEELPSLNKKYLSKVEEFCEGHFLENTQRTKEGRFSVKMPLTESPEKALGDSYNIAKYRFLSLEKKLAKSPKLKNDYTKFIKEYEQLGHLSPINRPPFGYYLPHHAVIRNHSETTRLRVVFDASCKTASGKSFNDIQLVGPVVQDDLFSILLRFRQNAFVVTGDIEKMYRQIEVDESQRHLQLIIWRDCETQPLKVLQLNTVTYGTASAPFLSTRCLLQLSEECKDKPDVANIIKHDFYIDDLNTGANSKEDLQNNLKEVISKLSEACLPLRKFRTNVPDIFENIPLTNQGQDFCKESTVLGLKWLPETDTLRFSTTLEAEPKVTKRSILSTSSKLFDPLGLLSAATITPKLILQRLWLLKSGWDDPIPDSITTEWQEFLSNLHSLSNVEVPRHVVCEAPDIVEMHCFTDASQVAYGACLYLKSTDKVGKVTVHLFCAKAKVAPLKPELTIPRLELMGALLGARLLTKVVRSLRCKDINISRCVLWTDSTIVLGWINSEPKTLKTFVCNRIGEIRELTSKYEWRHVPTQDNPADLASRGVRPQNLKENKLWWHGAPFLTQPEGEWPIRDPVHTSLPETKLSLNVQTGDDDDCFSLFLACSSLCRMQRILAYVLRFIKNCKVKTNKNKGHLTVTELMNSFSTLTKISQKESFKHEINSLEKIGYLIRKSRILSLNPFFDNDKVLRVGGRLQKALVSYNKKHPIILDSKHPFTKLLFKQEHIRLLHCGPTQLLSLIREDFWPIGGRVLATQTVNNCVQCTKIKGKSLQPIMGNLPFSRVNPAPPFETCGVDFAGPFLISSRKGRGAKTSKCYLCIFVCFSTRALHLEVVSELSTNAFISCLRRFISRRGKPRTIHCDNGKKFVGANNELGRMLKAANGSVTDFGACEGIEFKFIPAYAPNFGGIWEAGVKAAKYHLKRVAGNTSFTFEELTTLFAQIEAILNSRPLTPLSADPSDLTPLTPGHFLIGRPLSSLPAPTTTKISINRYQQIERIRQHFWSRWSREFLSELQQRIKWHRSKGRDVRIGDMVVVKDDHLPPMKWILGRISKLYNGPDGVCRVVDITTSKGIIRRALSKVCALPTGESHELLGTSVSKGGEYVDEDEDDRGEGKTHGVMLRARRTAPPAAGTQHYAL